MCVHEHGIEQSRHREKRTMKSELVVDEYGFGTD